jgi:plastocyanin
MRHGFIGLVGAALLTSSLLVPSAHAGQVRVNVSSNLFTPRAVNCNVGDYVVWVWTSGSHTSTSGDSTLPTPDGLWDTGLQIGASPNNGSTFNWRNSGPGTYLYYCTPHATIGMDGRVIVASSGIAVSDFRISEVLYNAASGSQLIEITNFGAAGGNLGRYRLSIVGGVAVSVPLNDVVVAAGGSITIHANATGTTTATDFYLSSLPDLPASGALSLYVPNTRSGATSLSDANQIIDFVQWGAGGGANEATAAAAGFWNVGDFVPDVAAGHSIEYCDEPLRHGASHWFDNPTPNFSGAANNCLTPVRPSSWGRIKSLYR